ncbi:DUF6002 family protein [Streptomyces sp. NPDC057445]|uniref:DUF6002 family protein n=1 Tax=Streptomyces sp. NPDC057445 TaxID=3346136 RepID=UPI003682F43B
MTTGLVDSTSMSVSVLGELGGRLRQALSATAAQRRPTTGFEPAFALPEPSDRLAEFFAVTDLRFAELGPVADTRLVLLDLMGNPGTRTVKSLASHVIVARAVRHAEVTGERVMILTPSSANKATALRDAVLRAYRTGLATPEQLRIVTVVPEAARPKLWGSELSDDPRLAARNPLCVLGGEDAGQVKPAAVEAAKSCATELFSRYGFRLWHTLELDNYRCADAVRAFAEDTAVPCAPGVVRAHAHAVSSAFGLLGHHFGSTLLPERAERPQYFLVQHLATADMVQSLYGTTVPAYREDPVTRLYRQDDDAHYPAATFSPTEELDSTFYTRTPATSPDMNEIIRRDGGGGVVVSLYECLARYAEIRALLAGGGVRLPADPRALREWSLVMVMTGVLTGIDRGLLRADEVIVHGSGSYADDDFVPLSARSVCEVEGSAGLGRALLEAAAVGTGSAE